MVLVTNMNIFKRIQSYFGQIKSVLGNNLSSSGFWSWAVPGEWSRRDLIKQYTRYVYTIISSIAENEAKVELIVNKVSPRGKVTILPNHPFLQIMRKPNPDWSKFQFLEMHFTLMKLMGESFWYIARGKKTKQPREFYLLRPDQMEVVIDDKSKAGLVAGYVLRKSDGTDIPFDKDEIQHFKLPNPSYPYRGMGPVQAGKVYIETEGFSSKWKRNSIYNSGRPSGIVNIKGNITKEAFDSLKKQWKAEYNGVENTGKTMFVKGADGLDYEKLSMDLNEIALRELRNLSLEDVMIMFRASKAILGITEDVNRANAHESKIIFNENIVIPDIERFVDQLDAFFIDSFGEDVTLTYKDPRKRSDEEIVDEITKLLYKSMTINDARKLRGQDEIPGGDKLYVPINLVPLSKDDTETEVTPPQKTLKKKVKRIEKDDDTRSPKASPAVIARAENFRTQLYNTQGVWEKQVQNKMVDEFNTQKKEILTRVKSSKNKKFIKKELEEWLFDVNKSGTRIVGNLTPMLLELVVEQAKLALELADDTETEFLIKEEIKRYVNERLTKMSDGTNELTIEKLKTSLSEGILNGESISKLIDRVEEIYVEATGVRAEMIARTETIAASNAGAEEAYRQSPMVTYKEWFANPGACEFCSALNGKVVGITTDFLKLGDSISSEDGKTYNIDYDDVGHPPLHPDCRCTILPVKQS